MTVWDDLVGQEPVVATLQEVVRDSHDAPISRGSSMTHAWLFTGPPGSGRSNAAIAFAAALQCSYGGCGECPSCVMVRAGSHPDITVINTSGLSIGIDAVKDYVRRAALHPGLGRWQVMIVEDADRLTEQAGNALLKAIEEPPPRTVWVLCAPAVEDVIVTIRSRSRAVLLRTPPAEAIARLLQDRDGVSGSLALSAATAAQGHIGRALALASRDDVRQRRRQVLELPARLTNLGECLSTAAALYDAAEAHASNVGDDLDAGELQDLRTSWGVEPRGKRPAGYAGALSSLEKEQKRRRSRLVRDSIDSALIDLLSFYRDVLAAQIAADAKPINADVVEAIRDHASLWTAESTMRRIGAILECREALTANAAPQLALEHLMIGLRRQ